MFTFDIEQQEVLNYFNKGQHSLCNISVAGAGKSTLVAEAIRQCPLTLLANMIVTAYNKHSNEDIAAKTEGYARKGQQIRSTYALGRSILFEYLRPERPNKWLNDSKYNDLAREYIDKRNLNDNEKYSYEESLVALYRSCQYTLTNVENSTDVAELMMKACPDALFDLNFALEALPYLQRQGVLSARQHISFADMISLPNLLDYHPLKKADLIIIDEAQDLNKAQHDTTFRYAHANTVFMIVGDNNQAIYGWAYALENGMKMFCKQVGMTKQDIKRTNISYRCPTSHIEKAQGFVPRIQARPNAPKGEIASLKYEDAIRICREHKAMVASRTTAPLVQFCYALVSNGIGAYVAGKNVGTSLIKCINDVVTLTHCDFYSFPEGLKDYRFRVSTAFAALENTDAIERLHDRCDMLEIIYQRVRTYTNSDMKTFKSECDLLFQESDNAIQCATWHRTKGLQASHVISLCPEDMPHIKAVTEEQQAEEKRIQYVAATRSTQFIGNLAGKDLIQ